MKNNLQPELPFTAPQLKEAGEDPADYQIPDGASKRQRGKILFSMMELICDVFKEGVVLDYSDPNQRKWYPWGEYKSGSGFALNGVNSANTHSSVGTRLCVDMEEKAQHIWKHFNKIYQEYWLDK